MQKVKVQIDSENKHKLFQIEKVLLLKTVSIFKDTSEEILTEIASILEEVDLKEGETVFEKGTEGDCMYVIFSGKVKVHDGESIFAHLSDRDFFGELSLLDPRTSVCQRNCCGRHFFAPTQPRCFLRNHGRQNRSSSGNCKDSDS